MPTVNNSDAVALLVRVQNLKNGSKSIYDIGPSKLALSRSTDSDCVPHRRKKNRRKVRSPKLTPKQTLSKRKITERNIAEIEMIDTKIVEIEIAEFFRSSILVFSHRRIFSPPTNLFGSFFELYTIHRDL
jgi:hypothetical protein